MRNTITPRDGLLETLRRDAPVRWLVFGGYLLFVFPPGHGWGYRFFQGAWGALPLLACGVLAKKPGQVQTSPDPLVDTALRLALLSLVLLNGLRLYQVAAWMDRHLAQRPAVAGPHAQVCFIRPWQGYYSVDLVQNDPLLRHRPLFLKSHGIEAEEAFMREHFAQADRGTHEPNDPVWYDRLAPAHPVPSDPPAGGVPSSTRPPVPQ